MRTSHASRLVPAAGVAFAALLVAVPLPVLAAGQAAQVSPQVPTGHAPGTASDGVLAQGDLPAVRAQEVGREAVRGEAEAGSRLGELSLAGFAGLLAALAASGAGMVLARRREVHLRRNRRGALRQASYLDEDIGPAKM